MTAPTRLLETLDGQQWVVFQRERYTIERRGRFRWQVVAHYRVLNEERTHDVGKPRRFRRTARRFARFLDGVPGYHPVVGPVDASAALNAIGVITTAPAPSPPEPGEVWANVQRVFQQIQDQPWYVRPARQFRCGQTVRDTLADLAQVPDPLRPSMDALLGIPVVVDETMPPNQWRLVDAEGNVLHEGTDGR